MSNKNFIIVNNTSMTVVELFVAPSNGEGWCDERLEGNRIKSGRSYLVEIEGSAKKWDISYKFEKSNAAGEVTNITCMTDGHFLSDIETITLTYDGRKSEPLTEDIA